MSGFVHPTTKEIFDFDWLSDARVKYMKELRSALDSMHRDIAAHSEKLRGQARHAVARNLKLYSHYSALAILCWLDLLFNKRRKKKT
jgi:hypothetical protein